MNLGESCSNKGNVPWKCLTIHTLFGSIKAWDEGISLARASRVNVLARDAPTNDLVSSLVLIDSKNIFAWGEL